MKTIFAFLFVAVLASAADKELSRADDLDIVKEVVAAKGKQADKIEPQEFTKAAREKLKASLKAGASDAVLTKQMAELLLVMTGN